MSARASPLKGILNHEAHLRITTLAVLTRRQESRESRLRCWQRGLWYGPREADLRGCGVIVILQSQEYNIARAREQILERRTRYGN